MMLLCYWNYPSKCKQEATRLLLAKVRCTFVSFISYITEGLSPFLSTIYSSAKASSTIHYGPIGLWCDKNKQKLIEASLTFAFISLHFFKIRLDTGISSRLIWSGARYLKYMGSDFWINSKIIK